MPKTKKLPDNQLAVCQTPDGKENREVLYAGGEPVIGERAKRRMKNKIKYTEGEMGKFKIIKDFLPSPSELAKRESNIKVTINIRKSSVDFFKDIASKNNVQYQRVIRSLLDTYATVYTGSH